MSKGKEYFYRKRGAVEIPQLRQIEHEFVKSCVRATGLF
jgi:hypothetical protein